MPKDCVRWTDEEAELLKANYPANGARYCAELLKRPVWSIINKARHMKLRVNRKYHVLTKEYLLEEYSNKKRTPQSIADDFGVSRDDVYYAIYKYGIEVNGHSEYGLQIRGQRHHNWSGFGEIHQSQWGSIVYAAKDRKIDFDISIEYAWSIFLGQNRKCNLTGIELVFSKYAGKYWKDTTASLDRKDSSQGYIEGNVQWIHKKLQSMKMAMPEDDFIYWCKLVAKYKE